MTRSKVKEPRARRTPEEGRRVLLDAAEALFIERGPDAAGLQSVASRAGVSHALITHYFGTYEGLVAAVVQRRSLSFVSEVGREISSMEVGLSTQALLDRLFAVLRDPVHVRLRAWGYLSGRAAQQEVSAAMLGVLSDSLYTHLLRVAQARRCKAPTREAVEAAFLIGSYATQWHTVAGGAGSEERFRLMLGEVLSRWLGL